MFHVLGADGHFLPMVPLGRRLQAEGHDVVFALDRAYCAAARERGFRPTPLDPPRSMTAPDVIAESSTRSGLDRLRFQVEGFLDVAVSNAEELVALAAVERPDILIRESSGWGAWLAGEQLDLPVAMFDYSPTKPGFFATLLGDLFQAARERAGLVPDPTLESLDRWLTIVGAPPGWFPAECFRPTSHLLQPPDDATDGGALPGWFDVLPQRPTVYATLGTVFNETPGAFEAVIDAVEPLDINVILTVGRSVDPSSLNVPDHVRVERFIPQALVLPRCDALVAHGGYGSLMGALRRGIPVVTIPLAAGDNQLNAERVERFGAGIAVQEAQRTPEAIRHALETVLREPSYRRAAQDVAEATASLPPFRTAVELVERLAAERSPVLDDGPGTN